MKNQALIQLSTGAWVAPAQVAGIWVSESDAAGRAAVTITLVSGDSDFLEVFDSAEKAKRFRDDTAERVNAALRGDVGATSPQPSPPEAEREQNASPAAAASNGAGPVCGCGETMVLESYYWRCPNKLCRLTRPI